MPPPSSSLFLFFATILIPRSVIQGFQQPIVTRQSPSTPSSYYNNDINNKYVLMASTSAGDEQEPQVMATGHSGAIDLGEAIQEATKMALDALPKPSSSESKIDLALISVSSLYDGNSNPSSVVPAILQAAESYGQGIQYLIGSSVGGFVSSTANLESPTSTSPDPDTEAVVRACQPVEREGVPGVSVTLCILPDVQIKTFHVLDDDIPDNYGQTSRESWQRSVGLGGFDDYANDNDDEKNTAMYLLPSPAFQNELDNFVRGLETHYSDATIFGAIASTVSSLSRARLFRYDAGEKDCIQTLGDGCVGVAMTGDLEVKTMLAQGAKPVGGVYQIVKGQESTISVIALDEVATELAEQAEESFQEDLDEDDDEEEMDNKSKMSADYAKARIPKPVLAEANFVMKTLSDDDQSFMRKALLVGLERGGALGRTPSELARLAEGKGHGYTVHQVASASMKDGSVTLSLGSVNVEPGMRFRFYVREADFAKKEVDALWMGHKRRVLSETIDGKTPFAPTGCFLFPTLDRGNKFFAGKSGFESSATLEYLPTAPCVSGFFSNGVIGALDNEKTSLYGSASGYVLFGSKSGRPMYSPAKAATDEKAKLQEEDKQRELEAEDEKRKNRVSSFDLEAKAPRDENGELILKRREIHSGRAMTVSAVEWSVAENMATPSSVLEGFMWDKETEVDRFRERVPLANLLSQCKLCTLDPSKPKPRDWVGPVKEAAAGGNFVIIPECKRMEPTTGSLRKRYDVSKIAKEYTKAGVPAMSVNCDSVLFGGSLEDVTTAREATFKAAPELGDTDDGVVVPPVLASDLLLYPYQLYKMRLAGADAVNLIVGALESKDLLYLTKIASSLGIQVLPTVSSVVQLEKLTILAAGSVPGLLISNRNLEDFTFDMSGKQALDILASDGLKEFREKHGEDIPVLVEGRVGVIGGDNGEGGILSYVEELKSAGAMGAIVGGGLVPNEDGEVPLESLMTAYATSL